MTKNIKFLNFIPQNSLESYIKTANLYPILTIEEENILSKELYYKNNLESAKKLILSHLRFVIHITRNYLGYGLPQADLIQEGNIGLMKAIRRFNPNIGVRLVSFAVHWIKAEIHEYILRNWRIVKVATTKSQRKLFFNLRKNKSKLGWLNRYEIKTMAKKLGVTNKDICEMESRMSTQDITFDPLPEDNSNEANILYYLKDQSSNSIDIIEKYNWHKIINKKLSIAINNLDIRSQDIINNRWLNNNRKSTLKELAKKYNVSAERIRQLEQNAMKKIRLIINDNL